ECGTPLRGRPEKSLEDEDIDVEHGGERRENEPGDDHARSRHECFGSYPSRRRALSIDSRVSWSPTAFFSGTSGKTSARSSELGRVMTVSAAAMMNWSNPAGATSSARSTAC